MLGLTSAYEFGADRGEWPWIKFVDNI